MLLAAFLLFFIVPVLWLLLAATKTDPELVYQSPFSFGSWHALQGELGCPDQLSGRHDPALAAQLDAAARSARW